MFNLEGVRREIEGDIAQLGERLPCKQEVAGSIPTISTNLKLDRSIRAIEYFHLTSSQSFVP